MKKVPNFLLSHANHCVCWNKNFFWSKRASDNSVGIQRKWTHKWNNAKLDQNSIIPINAHIALKKRWQKLSFRNSQKSFLSTVRNLKQIKWNKEQKKWMLARKCCKAPHKATQRKKCNRQAQWVWEKYRCCEMRNLRDQWRYVFIHFSLPLFLSGFSRIEFGKIVLSDHSSQPSTQCDKRWAKRKKKWLFKI